MSTTVCSSRREIPPGYFLAQCAVSGGDLRDYLRQARHAADGKLCVQLRPVYMDIELPCPSGTGRPLTQAELRGLHREEPCYFSQALCTEYFSCLREGALHVVLFDSLHSLRAKFRAIEESGVPLALIEDRALREKLK